jgi:protein-tyrosine phosphatase
MRVTLADWPACPAVASGRASSIAARIPLASAADLDRLHSLDLDIVVDFRSPGEKSPAEAAFGERFHWLAVPVLEGSMAMDVLVPRLRASTPTQMHDFMLDVYRDFPVRYREAFGAFLRHAEAGRTLFYHCTAGKDRTGFASLLLLSALGVSQDEIVANYLESNHWNRRLNEDVLARVAPIGVDADHHAVARSAARIPGSIDGCDCAGLRQCGAISCR